MLFCRRSAKLEGALKFWCNLSGQKELRESSHKVAIVWDLRSMPVTFDLLLVLLELHLSNEIQGSEETKLLIYVPSDSEIHAYKKSSDGSLVVDKADIRSRAISLLPYLAKTFKVISEVKVVYSKAMLREELKASKKIPDFYNPWLYYPTYGDYKKLLTLTRAPIQKDYLSDAPETSRKKMGISSSSPYAVFTLRDYGFATERDTSDSDLQVFLDFSEKMGFRPVVVPDDSEKLSKYRFRADTLVFNEARNNIESRHDVYRYSELNLFTNSGPALLSLVSTKAPTIIYNYGVGGFDSSIKYLKDELGLEFGAQPYVGLGGVVIWHTRNEALALNELKKAYEKLAKIR